MQCSLISSILIASRILVHFIMCRMHACVYLHVDMTEVDVSTHDVIHESSSGLRLIYFLVQFSFLNYIYLSSICLLCVYVCASMCRVHGGSSMCHGLYGPQLCPVASHAFLSSVWHVHWGHLCSAPVWVVTLVRLYMCSFRCYWKAQQAPWFSESFNLPTSFCPMFPES